jgi:hypothetical protein
MSLLLAKVSAPVGGNVFYDSISENITATDIL